jgi:hypothetical protein
LSGEVDDFTDCGANGEQDLYLNAQFARHLVKFEVVNTGDGTHDVHTLILGCVITDTGATFASGHLPQASPGCLQ